MKSLAHVALRAAFRSAVTWNGFPALCFQSEAVNRQTNEVNFEAISRLRPSNRGDIEPVTVISSGKRLSVGAKMPNL